MELQTIGRKKKSPGSSIYKNFTIRLCCGEDFYFKKIFHVDEYSKFFVIHGILEGSNSRNLFLYKETIQNLDQLQKVSTVQLSLGFSYYSKTEALSDSKVDEDVSEISPKEKPKKKRILKIC